MRKLWVRFAILGIATALVSSTGQAANCLWNTTAGGARYVVCMPDDPARWNGGLILFAHGYIPVGAPQNAWQAQLKLPGGPSLPELITQYGFGFAASSFSEDGLAVLKGVEDTMALPGLFEAAFSKSPRRVFVSGVSEGGLVAAKALEQYPEKLNGGLAACAPIGDFRRQIDYFGDARALFDYFFPGVLGDRWTQSNIAIPPALMLGWESTYAPATAGALQASPLKSAQLLSTGNISVGLNPANAGEAILSALWYNVFATNDAMAKLGGNPYENRSRWYSGSLNDFLLNLRVTRFTADAAALNALKAYQTTGNLKRPLVTLHTVWDPVVPAWQESLYAQKAAQAGKSTLLVRYPVLRFGHCAFNEGEVLIAFLTMVMHPYAN
ncbi:MAG: hypothetical protein NZR01_16060 [Bryobacteraceae bacterium]|nr:hypothetical protein [Bryobacteraceae bacterium]